MLSNICLHWFETCATLVAKDAKKVVSIVRYADNFVIFAGKWADGFGQRIDGEVENRFGLVVNMEKLPDIDADKSALSFLGYKFLYVRDRHCCKDDRCLGWCSSNKSVKKVCRKVKEETMRFLPVEEVIKRLNLVLEVW